ncbi:hypothetical protein U9M48_016407 [Paspalum notatum var. saurae]|uniref:Uncharacterized protein n=1 Tax=Paspalum notatum var. saurae TaxID=547442 RepID=A0AAQ3T6Z4_PASNO
MAFRWIDPIPFIPRGMDWEDVRNRVQSLRVVSTREHPRNENLSIVNFHPLPVHQWVTHTKENPGHSSVKFFSTAWASPFHAPSTTPRPRTEFVQINDGQNLGQNHLPNLDGILQQVEVQAQANQELGQEAEIEPMEEVVNLVLNHPPAVVEEELPAQVIIEPDEFGFDDGASLPPQEHIQMLPNPDLEVHIPQMQQPTENFLVDEIMKDQLMDPAALLEQEMENQLIDLVAHPKQVNFCMLHYDSEFSMDPGWASYLARKHIPQSFQFESRCPEAAKLWREFFAPSACSEKVDKGLLEDEHLQRKSKVTAPVGRKQNKMKNKSEISDDADSEERSR